MVVHSLLRMAAPCLALSLLLFGLLWEQTSFSLEHASYFRADGDKKAINCDGTAKNNDSGSDAETIALSYLGEEEGEINNFGGDDDLAFYDEMSTSFLRNNYMESEDDVVPNDDTNDHLSWHNQDLIRARPRNLRLVFVGDSITRYQYLSLAYWLRYGRWLDPSVKDVNNLVHAHSFHHALHPNEDWNEFFLQSNRMLYPLELCDCQRRADNRIAIERRYFRDDALNNTLVYINISGKSTLGHQGLYGRVNPAAVFAKDTTFTPGLLRDDNPEDDEALDRYRLEWEYFTWADLIRYHVGPLDLGPTAVAILNAGLHPNGFHDSLRAVGLEVALEDVGLWGVWKTTTLTHAQVQAVAAEDQPHVSDLDKTMCFTLNDCFNLAWLVQIDADKYYYDQYHFYEPVYRILNEDLLAKLGLLPGNYQRLDRAVLFAP